MSELAYIDELENYGGGVAAEVYGESYDVFRVTSTSNGSITTGAPVISGYLMSPERTTSKVTIEGAFFDLAIFEGDCDPTPLQFGDLLKNVYTGVRYLYAQHRPTEEVIFVRCEYSGTISRPVTRGADAINMPTAGAAVWDPAYSGINNANQDVLTLINGSFVFQAEGTTPMASIPIALQPLNRVRDGNAPKLPTTLYREHYVAYVPNLDGAQLQELDRLNLGQSDSYEIALMYNPAESGLQGYLLIVEKIATG